MKQLSTDWFMEGTLDFEYKKYVLLAYLQQVSREFAEYRLYPSFGELIFHRRNLASFQEEKRKLSEKFPGKISEEELKKLKLQIEPSIRDHPNMQEIEHIVSYSIPEIEGRLREGKEIYELIDEELKIEPIGIIPLYKKEGYIFLQIQPERSVRAFEYQIVFFENVEANYHGISMNPLTTFELSLGNTYEHMKRELIKVHQKFPNPATYLLYTEKAFPEKEALLPVAKRKMLAYLK
ncbi:MAG: hypothetical protein AAFR87_32665 [Bacteroidota bacterium]